ncbi:lytic transglycosylase domain-containing protein [Pseudomonas sp.]|uniref:lytic transglycosylase domain-containing protein n=1 Tax=Pseudomonas sp. TaxID=306 RepID=UPI003D0C38EF
MKFSVSVFVLGLALAIPTSVFARKAEIKNFGEGASNFQLVEPGYTRPTIQPPEVDVEPGQDLQLDRVFASLTPSEPTRSPISLVDSLSVPSWMRGGAKVLTPHLNLPAYTSISVENCGPVAYAPHPSLNASQELRRQRYFQQMAAAACGAGVPVELFDALIIQESRYNPFALSSKGASGLTQLMPDTARGLGVFDRWSITQNLAGGARYLRKQLDAFGNWALALGAYNAGPGNITKYGGLPPFRETRGYVRTILSSIDTFQSSRALGREYPLSPRRSVMLASFTK